MTLAERKVQATYYKRLAREGHAVDDVELSDAGVSDRPRISRAYNVLSLDRGGLDMGLQSVFDTPEAAWWRYVSSEAHALPSNYPRRRFLVLWASTGDLLNAARACGLTRKAGRHAVRKFMKRAKGNT